VTGSGAVWADAAVAQPQTHASIRSHLMTVDRLH
jgi:hypothetical protein